MVPVLEPFSKPPRKLDSKPSGMLHQSPWNLPSNQHAEIWLTSNASRSWSTEREDLLRLERLEANLLQKVRVERRSETENYWHSRRVKGVQSDWILRATLYPISLFPQFVRESRGCLEWLKSSLKDAHSRQWTTEKFLDNLYESEDRILLSKDDSSWNLYAPCLQNSICLKVSPSQSLTIYLSFNLCFLNSL